MLFEEVWLVWPSFSVSFGEGGIRIYMYHRGRGSLIKGADTREGGGYSDNNSYLDRIRYTVARLINLSCHICIILFERRNDSDRLLEVRSGGLLGSLQVSVRS